LPISAATPQRFPLPEQSILIFPLLSIFAYSPKAFSRTTAESSLAFFVASGLNSLLLLGMLDQKSLL
jgi:hypothetical protein